MNDFIKYVWSGVYKETIAVSLAAGSGKEARYWGEVANTPKAMDKLVGQLRRGAARCCFATKRALPAMGCNDGSRIWAGTAWWWPPR